MKMKGLTITRPNWVRYHMLSTSYPPLGPAGKMTPKNPLSMQSHGGSLKGPAKHEQWSAD